MRVVTGSLDSVRLRRSQLAALASAVLLLAVGCSDPTDDADVVATTPPGGVSPSRDNPLTRPGSPSVWVTEVTAAPISDRSDELVRDLAGQVESRYGGVAAFNLYQYTTSTWTAPWWIATTDVQFDDCQGKGYEPEELYSGRAEFADVPMPAVAAPAPGRDGHLAVYSPSSDQLWEFWKARRSERGWSACWGGRIDDVSESAGTFEDVYGASASGLAISAGALTADEARSGDVGHALSLVLPLIADEAVSWPAQRTDGRSDEPGAIPMGQRFRLDPDVDVEALDLHPVAAAVARSAQRYGFVVADTAGAVGVAAETGETASSAASSWSGVLDGTPSYRVLEGFPWEDLQALPRDWGEP